MKKQMTMIEEFFRKPLAIEPAALRMLQAAILAWEQAPEMRGAYGRYSRNVIQIRSEIAVIPVLNLLTYRSEGYWSYMYGDTTYQEIRDHFRQALADQSVSAIVLDIASPGGTVEGCFDLVDEIYAARSVKPIYALINESAYSAAYAIASAASKVFIPRTGMTGSIGILMEHVDRSKMESEIGLRFTEIYAGDRKIDGSDHAPLTDKARSTYQGFADQDYALFCETIARNRGLAVADVRAQQAAIYKGKEAVSAGLADSVLSWDAAWKKVLGAKTNQGGAMKTRLQALNTESPTNFAAAMGELGYVTRPEPGVITLDAKSAPLIATALGITPEQLTGDLSKIDFAALKVQIVQAAQKEEEARVFAYVKDIHDLCVATKAENMMMEFVTKRTPIEDARTTIQNARAAAAGNTQIRSTVGPTTTGAVNPLVADARKRAGLTK